MVRGARLEQPANYAALRPHLIVTVHGFRSAFRDWAGEVTNFPRDVAEAALAHSLRDKVEAAYRRGDALEKRRTMMAVWADFIQTLSPQGVVIPLGKLTWLAGAN